MKAIKIIGVVIGISILLAFAGMKLSGVSPIALNMHATINTVDGYALRGYDAVAYHSVGRAMKGDKKITASYNGVKWSFASEENKRVFLSNPDKYIPAVGGYCLFAVSKGFSAPGDPEHWSIEDGKLVLYSDETVKKTCKGDMKSVFSNSLHNWKD